MIVNRLKQTVELICTVAYHCFSVVAGRKRKPVVLYYHGIKDGERHGFRRQMEYLRRKYTVLKPTELVEQPAGYRHKTVAITFDDALASVKENAIPILREFGLSAGIFVPTGHVGKTASWDVSANCADKDEPLMKWADIEALGAEGFQFFSHSVSHCRLTELDAHELENELLDSRSTLERMLGHQVEAISYPYGAYDSLVCRAARAVGYRYGFTITPECVDADADPLQLGRFAVSPTESMLAFRLKAAGACQALKDLRHMKHRWFGWAMRRKRDRFALEELCD